LREHFYYFNRDDKKGGRDVSARKGRLVFSFPLSSLAKRDQKSLLKKQILAQLRLAGGKAAAG